MNTDTDPAANSEAAVALTSTDTPPRAAVLRIGAALVAAGFLLTAIAAPLQFSNVPVSSYAQSFSETGAYKVRGIQTLTSADAEHGIDVSVSEISINTELTLEEFMFRGAVLWGGYKFTYYSQQVLPGEGLSIPGRHVNAGGFVSDGDGYIVLAGSAAKGTVYDTPFGYQGKIYDRGTVGNHLDVYIR